MSDIAKSCNAAGPLDQIRSLYTDLALRPDQDFGWGKGKENARRLGYDPAWLEQLSDAVWESTAAVGNPFSVGAIDRGETVVDLGCGAGADLCIAALLVGTSGHVVGVDATAAMVAKARANATLARLPNIEVHEGDMARLPMPTASVDVVISNGAINLALDKAAVLNEAFRILRRGGRFQFADVVRDQTNDACCELEGPNSWADCVSGALTAEQVLAMLQEAGFTSATRVSLTDYRTSQNTMGAIFRAVKI